MKLKELKELIETSAINERKRICSAYTGNSSKYYKAAAALDENKKMLGQLARAGKLDVDILVLQELLREYFQEEYSKASNKEYIRADLRCSSYRGELAVYSSNEKDEFIREYFEVFDSEECLTGSQHIAGIEHVSILDLVPSYINPYTAGKKKNPLINQNPQEIINVLYKALEQTQQNRLKERRRFFTEMMEGDFSDIMTEGLKAIERQEQEGIEY